MTLENAKVLHAEFKRLGSTKHAEQQEARYPELKAPESKPEPKEEPKKDGKKPKR